MRARSTTMLGAIAGVFAVVLGDLVGVASRPPGALAGVGPFFAVAIGVGALLAGTVLGIDGEIARRVSGRRLGAAALGAVRGAFVWWLAVHRENPVSVGPSLRMGALAIAVAGGVAVGAIAFRRDRLGRFVGLVAALGGAAVVQALPLRQMHSTRLAMDLVVVAGVSRFLAPALARLPVAAATAAVLAALASLLAAGPLLATSEDARAMLEHRSAHARAFVLPLRLAFDGDRDGAAAILGGRDCDPDDASIFPGATERAGDGVDGNCEGGDGRPLPRARAAKRARGVAAGRDVLLLSIDSLRWDAAPELATLAAALGPHAEMTRAVCPAPRTMHSLSATMRGRPMREVRFDPRPGVQSAAPWRDPSPTLATVLARGGMRVFEVPTHRYIDPRAGIFAGARAVLPPAFASFRIGQRRPSGALAMVRATDALAIVRREAARSPTPFAAWVHLMEAHEPYHWGTRGLGPPTIAGLRRAVREVSSAAADLVRDLGRSRGAAPVVVVWGDHGEELGEHGGTHHGSSVHAESARVAYWIAAPGVPAGRFDAPVSTTSIPATVLDLLGLAAPASMVEPSLVPALSGERAWPDVAVTELFFAGRSLVGYTGRRFRLLYDPTFRIERLYDADADPLESNDLARTRPRDRRRMRRLARDWDESH